MRKVRKPGTMDIYRNSPMPMRIEKDLLVAVLRAMEKTKLRRLKRASGQFVPVAAPDGGNEWHLAFPMLGFNMLQLVRISNDGKYVEYRYLPIGSMDDEIEIEGARQFLRRIVQQMNPPEPDAA